MVLTGNGLYVVPPPDIYPPRSGIIIGELIALPSLSRQHTENFGEMALTIRDLCCTWVVLVKSVNNFNCRVTDGEIGLILDISKGGGCCR
jgi:hypothetical protein